MPDTLSDSAVDTGALTPRNIEEPASRCNICGSGLSSVEALLYGNRCLFCIPPSEIKQISFFKYIQHMTLDFFIYKEISRRWAGMVEKCQDCDGGQVKQTVDPSREDGPVDIFSCTSCNGRGQVNIGRIKLIGFLGAVGAAYYEELSAGQKLELLRELGRAKVPEVDRW